VTQTYNNCAETNLDGGVMSPFVSPCPPSLERTIQLSAHTKGPRRFCPHRSDRCRALMLTCRNSSLWQRFVSVWPPWLDQFNSVVITWHVR